MRAWGVGFLSHFLSPRAKQWDGAQKAKAHREAAKAVVARQMQPNVHYWRGIAWGGTSMAAKADTAAEKVAPPMEKVEANKTVGQAKQRVARSPRTAPARESGAWQPSRSRRHMGEAATAHGAV